MDGAQPFVAAEPNELLVAATLALALTRSAQAEHASLAQTEQRPRQRSLLRPPDARAAAAAAVAASSLSLPPRVCVSALER